MSKKPRVTNRACDSCKLPHGVDFMAKGVALVMCPTCQQSEFRIDRSIERAMERMTGWGRAAK